MEVSLSRLYSKVVDREISSDNSGDHSPPSTTFSATISSPKGSRRAIQKKVVTVPLKGSRLKGDCTPPSDSWAWRKYGQKPIKGSPYPRGYYRCSSLKGCPARKQVERSRSDPNTLVVTYSYEHNHTWPISRNNNNNNNNHQNRSSSSSSNTAATCSTPSALDSTTTSLNNKMKINNNTNKSSQLKIESNNNAGQTTLFQQSILDEDDPLIAPTDELTWLSSDHHILENNSLFSSFSDLDMSKFFPMREEDESLFADLEELPECSAVFRMAAGEECSLAWCGTTG